MKNLILSTCLSLASVVTIAQPSMVYDINSGSTAAIPNGYVEFNGKLYFAANNGINGEELWAYDGINTPSLVYDLNPGAAGNDFNAARGTAVVNGVLYFVATDGTNGKELYKYDGVNAPSIAADIESGASGSDPQFLTVLNNKIYFAAVKVGLGNELWMYDPATNTAQAITSIAPANGQSGFVDIVAFNNKIYFGGGELVNYGVELYEYDPQTNTTTMVQDINPGVANSVPAHLMVVGNKLYFIADNATYGFELYSYSGTGSPQRLTDLNPNAGDGLFNIPLSGFRPMIWFNNAIYMAAQNASSSYQLFKYDPQTNTTSLVYNINPGVTSSPAFFTEYANKIFFAATTAASGVELWSYDGTNPPSMITDLNPGTNNGYAYYTKVYNNTLYFTGDNGTLGLELYKYYDAATSVADINNDVKATAYPNPASVTFNIDIQLTEATNISVRLTDITGKQVYTTGTQKLNTGDNNITIPVQDLAAGMYYYNITGDDGITLTTGKIAKQ